ncbi:MAG: hypothetical protein GEU28_13070 [Dehalococcoidia bacterium]|nr:hypothetical protein [Dehalococcoidia bacterium]
MTATSDLAAARTCYDHLAGKLGVAVTSALVTAGALVVDGVQITERGSELFAILGLDIADARRKRRRFAYCCIDLTERHPHLAGSLGAALCRICFQARWIERVEGGRAIRVTAAGHRALSALLGADSLPAT